MPTAGKHRHDSTPHETMGRPKRGKGRRRAMHDKKKPSRMHVAPRGTVPAGAVRYKS